MTETKYAPNPHHAPLLAEEDVQTREQLTAACETEAHNLVDSLNVLPQHSLPLTLSIELLKAQQERMPGMPPITSKQLESGLLSPIESPVKIGKHASMAEVDKVGEDFDKEAEEIIGHLTKAWKHEVFERVLTTRDASGRMTWYYNAKPKISLRPFAEWPMRRIGVPVQQGAMEFGIYRVPSFVITPEFVDGKPVPYKEGAEVTVLPDIHLDETTTPTSDELWNHLLTLFAHQKALDTARARKPVAGTHSHPHQSAGKAALAHS